VSLKIHFIQFSVLEKIEYSQSGLKYQLTSVSALSGVSLFGG